MQYGNENQAIKIEKKKKIKKIDKNDRVVIIQ